MVYNGICGQSANFVRIVPAKNTFSVCRHTTVKHNSYCHLLQKADGNIITKRRYLIPIRNPAFDENAALSDAEKSAPLTIELDIFDAPFAPLMIAEVEFSTQEAAMAFLPPDWLAEDVTYDPQYHNSNLSRRPV